MNNEDRDGHMRDVDRKKNIRARLLQAQESPIRSYIEFTCGGDERIGRFIEYELLTFLLGPLPGAAGFCLRRMFYRRLFGKVGTNLIIGRNVVLRHPQKMEIGDHVTIDDDCLIDAHGTNLNGFVLGDRVIVNRNCMLQAKNGPVRLGRRTSLGSYTIVSSLDGVDFGAEVLTGGRCYFSAGAYRMEDANTAIMDQGLYAKGPISIGEKSYFGAGAMVVGGVRIGIGAVIGAGALVLKNVPDYAVAAGVPAKVLRIRKTNQSL